MKSLKSFSGNNIIKILIIIKKKNHSLLISIDYNYRKIHTYVPNFSTSFLLVFYLIEYYFPGFTTRFKFKDIHHRCSTNYTVSREHHFHLTIQMANYNVNGWNHFLRIK